MDVPLLDSSTDAFSTGILNDLTDRASVREIDVSSISERDLRDLRKADPFLYHSIPAARRAAVLMKDLDASEVNKTSVITSRDRRLHCPSKRYSTNNSQSTSKVTRRKSISYEVHTSMLLEDELSSVVMMTNEQRLPSGSDQFCEIHEVIDTHDSLDKMFRRVR